MFQQILHMYWSVWGILWFVCVQISSQKHRTDPWEERRSEKTQGATCRPSTEAWVVSYLLKLRCDFKTSLLYGNKYCSKCVLSLFHSYKNYGSGPTKYPLADMLQFVLEFASTKPTSVSPAEDLRLSSSSPTPASHPLSEPASRDNRLRIMCRLQTFTGAA